jgi:hypothetical protein
LGLELFWKGLFRMVLEEGEDCHGEDGVGQRICDGDLFNDVLDHFFDVVVSA